MSELTEQISDETCELPQSYSSKAHSTAVDVIRIVKEHPTTMRYYGRLTFEQKRRLRSDITGAIARQIDAVQQDE